NSDNGQFLIYNISNNQITDFFFTPAVGLEWQFSGIGNFSGIPGESDMILRNTNDGEFLVYNISNNQITGTTSLGGKVGPEWQFAGVAPIRVPGASDLVLRNVNTGQF